MTIKALKLRKTISVSLRSTLFLPTKTLFLVYFIQKTAKDQIIIKNPNKIVIKTIFQINYCNLTQ